MATIKASSADKIIPIKVFKGLNENRGGDTKLTYGEASECLNWQVTRDGNLRRRPGQVLIGTLSAGKEVKGIWNGWVNGNEYILAACNGKLYKVYDGYAGTFPCSVIGTIDTSKHVHFFAFAEKAYILNGVEFYEWNGTTLSTVSGYIPLVATSIGPDGTAEAAGTLLEQVNKLTVSRRVWISPDGSGTKFNLPEHPIVSVTSITNTATSAVVPGTDYTVNTTNGYVDFNSAPAVGVDSYEIEYTVATSYRSQVTSMLYSELYSGASDNRVFIYGNGTNKLLYSDMDYYGSARADYFPDLNEVAVGDSNTPITGLIRHFSRLICYKLDSTWSLSASTLSLADGSLIPSFYVTAVNRIIGCDTVGQVCLVLNSPRALFHEELYEWHSSQKFSGNITNDERQAQRISDRIYTTLHTFTNSGCICYDDNFNQEYYIVYNGVALVHNYVSDAWYKYDNIHATGFASFGGELYFGTNNGEVRKFQDNIKSDWDTAENDYIPINALWVSGAMPFGMEYARKYSSTIWVSVKPETNSYVEIGIITDRRTDFDTKVIARGTSGFSIWDFRSFSFSDNTQPRIKKLRLKAKKFVYYRLVFIDDQISTTATVLGADIRMRQTGYAK